VPATRGKSRASPYRGGDSHDAFLSGAALPTGKILAGAWLLLTHGNWLSQAYEIDSVERVDGKTQIVLAEDPCLCIGGGTTQGLPYPRRSLDGANRFTIPTAAHISIAQTGHPGWGFLGTREVLCA